MGVRLEQGTMNPNTESWVCVPRAWTSYDVDSQWDSLDLAEERNGEELEGKKDMPRMTRFERDAAQKK